MSAEPGHHSMFQFVSLLLGITIVINTSLSHGSLTSILRAHIVPISCTKNRRNVHGVCGTTASSYLAQTFHNEGSPKQRIPKLDNHNVKVN